MIEILLQADRLLLLGLLDQAERLYRQVADADPRNAIAHVGLARVAVERADDAAAYVLARRALDIDPENVAAYRLAARLEEMLAGRGEPLPAVDGPDTVASLVPSRGPVDPPPPHVPRPGPAAATPPAPAGAAKPVRRRGMLDRLLRRRSR